ncbi:hypothetical protein [Chamaesiphon sp.]|uniref:hypothetical protein n=1 Tax=Chamaesiphon sp. TaxID=2814140 RepID=UPI003594798C
MPHLDAIRNYTDHPSRKYDPIQFIYLLNNGFYLGSEVKLFPIILTSIYYANLGEPYRQLARLEFSTQPMERNESIEIAMKDAARLISYCQKTNYKLKLDPELMNHREFLAEFNPL